MDKLSINKRRFMKFGILAPFMANFPLKTSKASGVIGNNFLVPDSLQHTFYSIYGYQANNILYTDRIKIKAPEIAENGAVVPITISGDQDLVSSLSLYIAENSDPVSASCKFNEYSDLNVGFRVKLNKSSGIYLVAETYNGMLLVVEKYVKITMGCGGG